LFLIARKNGKSELCSALLLAEMILGGEGLDIVCSSNDDNQADILYVACDTMRLLIDPKNLDTWRNQKHIKCTINNNKIFKLSDKTRNKEGRNIDIAVVDEVHEMKDNIIIKSIEQSQSLKPNPKLILITTEGFVNDGFLDAELLRARGILRGEIMDAASIRYLPWLYTQDGEGEIWQDENTWKKSNPTLGIIKKWDYLRQQIDLAKQSTADRAFVLSKDFNVKQNTSTAWLMLENYDYELTFDLEEFRGALCLGACDLAETTDLSCAKVLLMKPNDPKKYIFTKYFIPEGKLERNPDIGAGAKYLEWARDGLIQICEGDYLDTAVVADWFASLYRDYGLRPYKIGYDVKFATSFLQRMDEYGLDTVLIYQSAEVLNDATKMVEVDLKARKIIGNNAVDKWCFGNAALKVDSLGRGLIVKMDGLHNRKIDGAVCTAILYEVFKRFRGDFTANL
jgi:phage terminase large subunit-like protein